MPTDTLVYQYKIITQRSADCGSKPDSSCTSATFKYPVFNGQQALNDTIGQRLANLFAPDGRTRYANPQQAAAALVAQYADNKKNGDVHSAQMHYALNSHATVIRQDSTLITLELSGYDFTGGAHGLNLTSFINWDARLHKTLQLNDVFAAGYEQKLNQIAEQIFRKNELLSPAASLADDYFFKNAKFVLNNNFVITPLGLRFVYNPYEIKPYAAGQTTIDIPYTQISKLLRPGGPAALFVH